MTTDTAPTALHRHAVEVDTRIADTYRALKIAEHRLAAARIDIRRTAGQRQADYGRGPWNGSYDEAVERVEALAVAEPVTYRNADASRALNRVAEFLAVEAEAFVTYNDAEQDYQGWSRFFLVVDGHIHSSLHCSTCYPTTAFSGACLAGRVEVWTPFVSPALR